MCLYFVDFWNLRLIVLIGCIADKLFHGFTPSSHTIFPPPSSLVLAKFILPEYTTLVDQVARDPSITAPSWHQANSPALLCPFRRHLVTRKWPVTRDAFHLCGKTGFSGRKLNGNRPLLPLTICWKIRNTFKGIPLGSFLPEWWENHLRPVQTSNFTCAESDNY